jgi:paraquat-inducible protein B
MIGLFVIAALALVVAAVIVFGGGRFLTAKSRYILYFSESVKGLSIGAPVDFRGVKIGSVVDVNLVLDMHDSSLRIPVVIEIERDRIAVVNRPEKGTEARQGTEAVMEDLIEKGLKGQLETQSFLTGQLYIAMDIHPDMPIVLSEVKSQYREIPTIPSKFEQISQKLERIPLEEIIAKVSATLDGIERFVNSPELEDSRASLNAALKSINILARNLNGQVGPISSHIQDTAAQAKKMLKNVDGQIGPTAGEIRRAANSLRELAGNSEQNLAPLLANASAMIEEGSPLRYKLTKALDDLSAASLSLRNLADSIERHPEAIIRGKTK